MAAVRIENLRFHGGLNQLHLGTNDIDCAFWVVRDCVFSVSRMTVANIWVSFYQRIPKLIYDKFKQYFNTIKILDSRIAYNIKIRCKHMHT